jgi:hypothetical protein
MLTHPEHLSDTHRSLRDELTTACPEMIDPSGLITSFATLPRPQDGNSERLDEWITTARAADLPRLHAFTRGMDLDRAAVHAAVTLPPTQRGNRRREHQDQTAHAADARTGRLQPAPSPHPARLTSPTAPPNVRQSHSLTVPF